MASVTRSSNGATITMSANVPSSATSVDNYFYRYSTDNANWAGVGYTNSSTPTYSNWAAPSATTGYWISAQAHSSEGWSGAGSSSFIAGIPTPPAAISANRTARNVTVTISGSPSNGGAAITSYTVQYSTDGGSTWTGTQDITSGSYTYTNLTSALTYTIRAYATNATGNSSPVMSAPIFVPAGGRRFDGTSWVSTTVAKRYDGTSWVDLTIAKRFNGTSWVDLS